jgi:hypothetical protein
MTQQGKYVQVNGLNMYYEECCFCQLKTGPLDHRKQGHSGHLSQILIIENRAI